MDVPSKVKSDQERIREYLDGGESAAAGRRRKAEARARMEAVKLDSVEAPGLIAADYASRAAL